MFARSAGDGDAAAVPGKRQCDAATDAGAAAGDEGGSLVKQIRREHAGSLQGSTRGLKPRTHQRQLPVTSYPVTSYQRPKTEDQGPKCCGPGSPDLKVRPTDEGTSNPVGRGFSPAAMTEDRTAMCPRRGTLAAVLARGSAGRGGRRDRVVSRCCAERRTPPGLALTDLEQATNDFDEIVGQAGLGDERITAGAPSAFGMAGERMPGQRDDDDLRRAGVAAQASGRLPSVHEGESRDP